MTRTRNVIPLADSLRLIRWAEGNRDVLKGKTRAEVTAMAGQALSLSLTENNLTSALEAGGVNLEFHRSRAVGRLVGRSKTWFVAAALRDLMVALGHPVPQHLRMVLTDEEVAKIAVVYDAKPSP